MSTVENYRIVNNTFYLYLRMFVVMGISIFTSRIILNTLGVSDYGINNLVSGIVGTFTFIVGSLSTSVQRFLSISIGRKDSIEYYKVFKTSQKLYLKISVVFVLLSEILGWVFLPKLNIPPDRIFAAHWIFQLTLFTLFLNVNSGAYQGVIVSKEKFSISATISVLESLMRLILVWALEYVNYDKLITFGLFNTVISIISFATLRALSINLIEKVKVIDNQNKGLSKELLSYSSWNLFGAVSIIARSQGIIVILNIFFGVFINAAYAIANQVKLAIEGFSSNFTVSVLPQITQSYGAGDLERMQKLIFITTKISFLLLFIITFPIIMETDFFLKVWLGTPPKFSDVFTVLILVNALIDVLSTPLMTGIQATGRIKFYQILIGSLLIANFPISYIVYKFGGEYYICSIVSIFISIVSLFSRLIIAKKLFGLDVIHFLCGIVRLFLLVIVCYFVVIFIQGVMIETIYRFMIVLFAVFVLSTGSFYVIVLDKVEKTTSRVLIGNVLNKFTKSIK